MTWLDLTENSKALTSIYSSPPSLSGAEILSIKIDRDGPTAGLVIALSEYPSSPPERWRAARADAVTVDLQLMAVDSIEIRGWSTTNVVDLSIQRRDESHLELLARSDKFEMKSLFGFLRITHIAPYSRAAAGNRV